MKPEDIVKIELSRKEIASLYFLFQLGYRHVKMNNIIASHVSTITSDERRQMLENECDFLDIESVFDRELPAHTLKYLDMKVSSCLPPPDIMGDIAEMMKKDMDERTEED